MLELYFFNVEHGDSIAIHFPNNEWGVVDCKLCDEQRVPNVLSFLIKNKVEKLKFVCVTHPHMDHFNGIDTIVAHYKEKIDNFIIHNDGFSSPYENDDTSLMKALTLFAGFENFKAQNIIIASRCENYTVGEIEIKLLNPNLRVAQESFAKRIDGNDLRVFNKLSVVMYFEYAGKRILLNADVPKKECKEFLGSNPILADVVKISHHGSIHNNSDEILLLTSKKNCISIISSDGNQHYPSIPHPKVLECLGNNICSNILKTYELGRRILPEQELETIDMIDGLSEIADKNEPVADGYFKVTISKDGEINHGRVLNI